MLTDNSAPEQIWTPEPEAPKRKISPLGLTKSVFRDERGGVYHLEIDIEGGKVFALELDDDDYAEFKKRAQWLRSTRPRLVATEMKAKAAAARKDDKLAQRLRVSAESESQKLLAEENELPKWMIARTVVGWDFPRAFDPQSVLRLTGESQTQIVDAVRQASNVGRDSDFLAAAS